MKAERYNAYKDSGLPWLGEIPAHWEIVKGKRIYVKCDGGVWGDEPIGGSADTIVLRSTEQDINGNLIIVAPARRHLSAEERERSLLALGDLIITKSSGSLSHIGKTSIIDECTASLDCCFSNFIQRVRVKGNSRYYWHLFNTGFVREQFKYKSTTTTGLGNLSAFIIGDILLPVPPLEEQRAIAEYLDEKTRRIDEIIERFAAQKGLYDQLKRSLISEVVSHGLPHHNHHSFRHLRLKDIAEVNPPLPVQLSDSDIISFIPMENMMDGNYVDNQSRNYVDVKGKYSSFVNGDILLAKISPCFENGNIAIVNDLQNGVGFGSTELVSIRSRRGVEVSYLFYYLRSQSFRTLSVSSIKGVGGLKRVDIDTIRTAPISLPTLDEQREIATYLDERCGRIDRMVELVGQKIELMESLKKSLIEEVVTGQRSILHYTKPSQA